MFDFWMAFFVVAGLNLVGLFILVFEMVQSSSGDPRHRSRNEYKDSLKYILRMNRIYLGQAIPLIERIERVYPIDYTALAKYPKLHSRYDEVINSLAIAPNQKVEIAIDKLLKWPVVILMTLLISISIMTIYQYQELVSHFIDRGSKISLNIIQSFEIDTLNEMARSLSGSFAINFIVALFISFLLSLLLYRILIAKFAVYLTNSLFKQSLLVKAYGRDTRRQIGWASSNPPGVSLESDKWKPLPKYFDKKYEDILDVEAVETMRSARIGLGLAAVSGSTNLSEAILGSLTMSELVHTSYFELQEFIDFIAWLAVSKFGFEGSKNFHDKVDTDLCKRFYFEMSPLYPSRLQSFCLDTCE